MIPAWVNGEIQPVEKLDAHLRGLRHKAVSVFVLSGNQVLLQRRALGKYHTPGLWANACCTHPQFNETPEACAHRRVAEELNISGLNMTYRGVVEYRADVGGDMVEHEVVDVFTAEVVAPMPVDPNPDEVMATTWLPLGTLIEDVSSRPTRYAPWLRIYLQKHADMILGAQTENA